MASPTLQTGEWKKANSINRTPTLGVLSLSFFYNSVSFRKNERISDGVFIMKTSKILLGVAGTALLAAGLASGTTKTTSVSAAAITSVSTWDGTTRTAPTHSVKMGGKTFYLIESAAQLASLAGSASNSNNYLLMTDIDLASFDWTPIASIEFNAIDHCQFTGTFDGNGHTIRNFKLPGTESSHRDYTWASAVSSSANYASSIGFFGRVGSAGIVKNMRIVGSTTHGGVGTTAHYWYNGGLVGHNFGLIRNVSLDGVGFRSDAWYQSGIAGWSSIVNDSGIGILCGRNEGKMNYTTTKNSYLYCYETGGKTTWNGDLYIANFRYGQNCGYNNRVTGWEYTNNYYYNNTENWASGGYGVNPEVDSRSIVVSSATGFDPTKFGGGDSSVSTLTDNFVPFDSAGTIYQNQTSKSLDQAIALLGADCATCTSSYIQGCINDYNTNSASKNVYNNLTSGQTYNGNTTDMSGFCAKMKAFADRYGLNVNAASGIEYAFQVANNSHQPEATIFVVMASAALLAAGAYVALKRKDA
jgi:hypothetical protein